MDATPKTKLCWNCEARVSPYEENCPYCCVYLNPQPKPKGEEEAAASLAPPYQIPGEGQQEAPPSPYQTEAGVEQQNEEQVVYRSSNGALRPMILLLCGSIFLLFSISLLLFSVDGVLTLKWNGKYWYIYLIVALPLLLFGWRALQSLDEEVV